MIENPRRSAAVRGRIAELEGHIAMLTDEVDRLHEILEEAEPLRAISMKRPLTSLRLVFRSRR